MYKVGITGGIGSGKSTIAKIFACLGIPIFDADAAAKNIMETNAAVKNAITQLLGKQSYIDGSLNRNFISSQVFPNLFLLEKLNAIVHPAAIAAANEWANKQQSPYVIKEAALLFESGSVADVHTVVGVFAPDTIRLHRAMQRDGATKQQVEQRMFKQIPQSLKMRLCDFVIDNSGNQLVIPQVLNLHKQLLEKASTHEAMKSF